jgi:hypothetical protein
MAFSAKAVIVKLAYAYAVDAATLLALRMLFSAPFFVLMALWSGRGAAAVSLARKDWLAVALLGFIGYYLASYLDFLGLQYITAGLERLILFLYPTVVCCCPRGCSRNLFAVTTSPRWRCPTAELHWCLPKTWNSAVARSKWRSAVCWCSPAVWSTRST